MSRFTSTPKKVLMTAILALMLMVLSTTAALAAPPAGEPPYGDQAYGEHISEHVRMHEGPHFGYEHNPGQMHRGITGWMAGGHMH
ncbi:MAG: hypothetical protein Kow00129_09450 [Thermoleophilia bacterium]